MVCLQQARLWGGGALWHCEGHRASKSRFPLPEFTARVDGPLTRVHFLTPVNSGRVDGCQKCRPTGGIPHFDTTWHLLIMSRLKTVLLTVVNVVSEYNQK